VAPGTIPAFAILLAMTDPLYDEPRYLTELPEDLKLKRAEAARRRRLRRRLALGALLAVAGAVVALGITSLGGGSDSTTASTEAQQSQAGGSSQQATTTYPTDWKPHPGPVPILEYHAIQPPPSGAEFPQQFVPQADFQRQMQWLKDKGYEAVTLTQVETAWYEHGELPPKPIVITFDDSYLSQYVAAFPELQHLGWKGVLNLVAQGSDLPDADVKKMLDAGWELGSHSITHPDLTTLGPAELEREVAGSREILKRRFSVPVENFSYPFGLYDDTVISAVHKAGYVGAQAEVPGSATAAHPYILNRIEIELDDGLSGFTEKLRSAESGSTTTTTTTTTTYAPTTYPTTTYSATSSTTTTETPHTTTTRTTTKPGAGGTGAGGR
jgi:peptidoglycan/xylan/chitin deacetylase (PgdA/CDA1 family)